VAHFAATASRLNLDVEGPGTRELVVVATSDRLAERVLLRVKPQGRTSRDADVTAFAGHVTRLSLRGAGPGDLVVHGLTLVDRGEPRVPVPPARPWNVVVYVIDTLRADHLGCAGSTLEATPRIDDFARSAVRFAHAVSQSSWTLPSIGSLLTGLLPSRHGATGPGHAIRTNVTTLPAALAAAEYTTAAFVTNYLGSEAFGFDLGFSEFRFYRERGATRRKVYLRSDALHRRILHWLDRQPRAPFMLWVHATDPHYPYLPPRRHIRWRAATPIGRREVEEIVDEMRPLHNGNEAWGARPVPVVPNTVAVLRDLYAGEVRAADEWFGRLVDELAARALLDETVIVVTSDHGEEFLEHGGLAHGQTLHGEVLDVPLLVRLPGGVGGGTVVGGLARHVDLVPTILALVGVPAPPAVDGVALLGADTGTPDEAYAALRLGRFDQDAVLTPEWKVVRNLRASRVRLFDTVSDPAEQIDLAASGGLRLRYADRRLRALSAARSAGPRVDADRLERLRALGYATD
jgi:arylsulfatase A-like enzyme